VAVLPLTLAFALKHRAQVILPRPEFQIGALIFIWLGISLIWRDGLTGDDIITYARHSFFLLVFMYAAYSLFFLGNDKAAKFFWDVCIAVAVIAAAGSIAQYILLDPSAGERLRPLGQLEQPVLGASVYGMFGLVALFQCFQAQRPSSRILYGVSFAVIGLLICLTYSRGPILAYFLTSLFMTALVVPVRINVILIIAVGIAALFIALTPELLSIASAYKDGLLKRGVSYRTEIWAYAYEQIKARPILGWGVNAPFDVEIRGANLVHAHNLMLGTLYYGGIVAGLMLAAFFAAIVKKLVTIAKAPSNILIAALLAHIALSIITDNAKLIIAPSPFWIFFWLPICYCLAIMQKRENAPKL